MPRSFVVYNGVAAGDKQAPVRPKLGDRLNLLFVGRLTEQKNPMFLVEVMQRLRETAMPVRLTVVGEGAMRSLLAESVHVAGLDDVMELEGYRDEPKAAMLNADILLTPARREGFPFVVLEALSAGLPVVASDIPPHGELATMSPAIRLASLEAPDEWIRQIMVVASDHDAMRAAALRVSMEFTHEQMVEGTVAVYRAVLGQQTRRGLGRD